MKNALQYIFSFGSNLEDFVTWVDTSAIRKHILEYNNTVSYLNVYKLYWPMNCMYLMKFFLSYRETIST